MLKLEKKKYLTNNWFLVGTKSEIQTKNDFKTFEIFEEPLIVYNTGHEIKTFLNICPHRGSKVKIKNKGNEILRCEYHGWCFDKNGKFISAPFLKILPKKKPGLKKWLTETYNDLIFIAKPGVKITLKKYLQSCMPQLKVFSKNIGQLVNSESHIWNCNWKVAVENSIDEYHAPYLHKNTFKNVLNLKPKYFGNNKALSMKMPVDKKYLNSIKKIENFFLETNDKNYTHILFFPCTTFATTMGIFNFVQTYFPISEKITKVTSDIYINLRDKKEMNNKIIKSLIDFAVKFNQTVFNEDKSINENLMYKKNYNKSNIFTNLEFRVKKFRTLTDI
jgi:phenylpropionate dioxygenase-like ring-hydroxylating dioxygenase large terminal subunit